MKNDNNTAVELGSMFAAVKRQLGEGWTEGQHEPFVLFRKLPQGGSIKVRCCTTAYRPIYMVTRFWPEKGAPATSTECQVLAEALRLVAKLLDS